MDYAATHGIDLNRQDNNGLTGFHWACQNRNSMFIKIFMDSQYSNSIDHNRKDNHGNTAFHYVCEKDKSGLVKIFMENAAALSIDLHVKSNSGMSGLDIAIRMGCTDVVKIFCLMEKASALSGIDLNKNGEDGLTKRLFRCGQGFHEERICFGKWTGFHKACLSRCCLID